MAKNAVSENALKVLDYLKEIGDANVTAADIALALGYDMDSEETKKKSTASINGIITAGLQRKGLTERVLAQIEVENENGEKVYKDVKFIKVTDAGRAYNHEDALAADEAAAAEKAE